MDFHAWKAVDCVSVFATASVVTLDSAFVNVTSDSGETHGRRHGLLNSNKHIRHSVVLILFSFFFSCF